ncbi:uncharacterized protein LOC110918914 [Helianthus annuus]|uniref:uncharacterized protein LOC110918914 n=1 Tax=Helianthus annuus TaxID=4232 RepID=UPI000B8F5E35|nr:uncharacterized protein LOC110918914 [Helianthus annuus]
MEEEFYNAFATPVAPITAAEIVEIKNEMGTSQKPPKLIYIEDFKGWQNRFETWVQAYKFDAWVSLDKDYVNPKDECGSEKSLSDYSADEKLKYTTYKGEMTKRTIDRYCHLVQEMKRLEIKKEDDEWVDKLSDALPQDKWGTYLLILKHMRKSESMNLCKFIQKIEEHELDVQKTAIMNNPNAQQDDNKIEMLKEKRAARLERELEDLEARRIAEEKAKMEAEKAKVEENSTEKVEDEECKKWVVKSESSSDNESDSSKSEESFVVKNDENSVPEMNDEKFPPLSKENLKLKVGKIEISNQFFPGKEEFEAEKFSMEK